ncbi:hypothetical protein FXO38_17675 [Capsicum annuum]|nr:hypothetical protein FXO38_17675 [Capsicum annuum]
MSHHRWSGPEPNTKERFDINLDEHYVKDSCEDILKNRTWQWRYKLKQKFESSRSVEEARKMEKRCEINKVNRTKRKSNHFMGSKAFVASRAEIGEKEHEGVERDRIEFYKHTHYTSEKRMDNMTDLKALYTSGESSMTIDEIVDVVLGTKSGYIKGLGYGPKPNTTRETQRIMAELEDSLEKAKQEAASTQNELQK